jgi:hypothetical protein
MTRPSQKKCQLGADSPEDKEHRFTDVPSAVHHFPFQILDTRHLYLPVPCNLQLMDDAFSSGCPCSGQPGRPADDERDLILRVSSLAPNSLLMLKGFPASGLIPPIKRDAASQKVPKTAMSLKVPEHLLHVISRA